MKSILPFLALSFIIHSTSGQQISRGLLTTAGDVAKNENGVSLSWTIGDVFCQTNLGEQHLTEGFQQGDLVKKIAEVNSDNFSYRTYNSTIVEEKNLSIQVSTFPNPTTDQLTLSFVSETPQIVMAYIFDERGHFILQEKITVEDEMEVTLPQIRNLSAGRYFIEFVKNGKTISTEAFVKIKL